MTVNNVSIIVIIKNIFKDLFDTIKYFVHHPLDCCQGNIFMYVMLYVLSVYICGKLCVHDYFMANANDSDTFIYVLSWLMCALIVLLFDMLAFLLFMGLAALVTTYKEHYINKYGYPKDDITDDNYYYKGYKGYGGYSD